MKRASLGVALLLVCAAGGAAEKVALTHGGEPRSYLLHRPPQAAAGAPLPLLIALHGTSMRAADMFGYTDLPQLADRVGLVLAAPQSLGIVFNDGLGAAGSAAAAVDDVGFVEAVADDVKQRAAVRADAVYVVGFSNGASLAQRLAIESRYPFGGFAAVAGAVRVATPGVARAAPLLLVFGSADPLNPPEGGLVWIPVPHVKAAPAQRVRDWAARLHCEGAPQATQLAGVPAQLWPRCAEGARLAAVTIEGLGHHWAGARPMPFPSFVVGPQVATPRLGELVWQFLAAPPR